MKQRALFSGLLLIALSIMACDSLNTEWGYSGSGSPGNWGTLSDEYKPCADGVEQSPVNITGYVAGEAAPIAFFYGGMAATARNTGKTLYLDYGPGSAIDVGGQRYELQGIHSHSLGEHLLDRESFPAELHLVHRGADGKLAVVGLLFRTGAASPLIQNLLDAAPETGAAIDLNNSVNAADYVPAELGYYGYSGSLTTPPCTEGVRWIMMQAIGTVSPEQVNRLQALSGGLNNRPVQPVGERRITVTAG